MKKINDMSHVDVSKKWKDTTSEINNLSEESENYDYKWLKNSWFIDCINIETSSSHQ